MGVSVKVDVFLFWTPEILQILGVSKVADLIN